MYQLELTERQARILSSVCDQFGRLICGQDWFYQKLLEAAWEKRCKKATGKTMDKDWDGGWSAMRDEAEKLCKDAKKRFWGLDSNVMNGIGYDETSDILFDLHQVIRHQLWLDRPDKDKSRMTVDSDEPMRHGSEPLARMGKI